MICTGSAVRPASLSAAPSRQGEPVATGEWSHCVMADRIGWMAIASEPEVR